MNFKTARNLNMKAPCYIKGFITWDILYNNLRYSGTFLCIKRTYYFTKCYLVWSMGYLLFSQGVKCTNYYNGVHPSPSLMNSVGSQPWLQTGITIWGWGVGGGGWHQNSGF